jgi:5'-3' exoribonuclease 2
LEWNETGNEIKEKKNHFDSNCITPGTPFMDQLAVCLRYYITDRLNNDPGWKNIQVILSDASVPGEGEHKIMDFIRRQKSKIHYNPNTKHVLYGLDADLIMLALATHEPNFWILREDVQHKHNQRACQLCGQTGHDSFQCKGTAKERIGKWDDQSKYLDLKPFIFVHISVLREYLETEMKLIDIPFSWNVERAIDDWVFMCFFVGNDFLPHLPSLDIREGALELLIDIWKSEAKNWTGYLTDSGNINLDRVQTVLERLGTVEDVTFQERREEEERRRISRFERKQRAKDPNYKSSDPRNRGVRSKNYLAQEAEQMNKQEKYAVCDNKRKHEVLKVGLEQNRFSHRHSGASNKNDNEAAAKRLKMQLLSKKTASIDNSGGSLFSLNDFSCKVEVIPVHSPDEEIIEENENPKEIMEEVEETGDSTPYVIPEKDSDEDAPEDDVRLWESGWKTRYYENKFKVDVGDDQFRNLYNYVDIGLLNHMLKGFVGF